MATVTHKAKAGDTVIVDKDGKTTEAKVVAPLFCAMSAGPGQAPVQIAADIYQVEHPDGSITVELGESIEVLAAHVPPEEAPETQK